MFQNGRNGIDGTFLLQGPPPKLTIIEAKASGMGTFSYSDAQKLGGEAYFQQMINGGDPKYAGFFEKFQKLNIENPGLEFDYIRVETDVKITKAGFGIDELKIKVWSEQ